MNDSSSLPAAISHKKLNSFLNSAKKELSKNDIKKDIESEEKRVIEKLFNDWTLISKKLLSSLNKKSQSLTKNKSPKSLMALGALEVHLNMALQAKQSSELEE